MLRSIGRVERHIRDVDAAVAELERQPRHHPGRFGTETRSSNVSPPARSRSSSRQQSAAAASFHAVTAGAVRACERRRGPRAGARSRRRARRSARRGWRGRCRSRSRSARRRRGSHRGRRARSPGAGRDRPRAPLRPARRARWRARAAGARPPPASGRGSRRRSRSGARRADAATDAAVHTACCEVRSTGVRYQVAPSNRSARAWATPPVSAPASGWPPTNSDRRGRRRRRAWSSRRRSRRTAPAPPRAPAPTSASSAPTRRRHEHGIGAAHRDGCGRRSVVERAMPQRGVKRTGRRVVAGDGRAARSRAASATEPPISPTPSTAIRIVQRRPLTAPGAGSRTAAARPSSSSTVVLPADAAVGDRLAVARLAPLRDPGGRRPGTTRASRRRSRRSPPRSARRRLRRPRGWRSGSLPLLSWRESTITRSGSPAARSSSIAPATESAS